MLALADSGWVGGGIKIELTFFVHLALNKKTAGLGSVVTRIEGKITVNLAVQILGGWEGDKNRIDFVCASGPNPKRPPALGVL